MFTNILFLILALLITATPIVEGIVVDPVTAWILGVGLWVLTLVGIRIQKLFYNNSLSFDSQLILCLIIYQFFLGSQKIFIGFPDVVPTLFLLSLYLIGIAVTQGMRHFLFLLPFTLPFIILTALFDFTGSWSIYYVLLLASIVIVLIMVFMPAFITFVWKCNPLESGDVKMRLQSLCNKVGFKHAGFQTWNLLDSAVTAAIVGVVPSYRYVMFTPRMILLFRPEWLEAVLAHEIGHSKNYHLLLYPFISLGLVVISSAVVMFAEPFIAEFYIEHNVTHITELYLFTMLVLFALVLSVAFRFIFGFFSRLFERQADLYIYKAGLDPNQLMDALNELGNLTGNSHNQPNWHHYSIRQRIACIKQAEQHPEIIYRHDRKVRLALILFFIITLLIGALT